LPEHLTVTISVYDRMCWPAGALERALRDGSHRRELAAYLGPAEYSLLRALAVAGARGGKRRIASRAKLPKVYLLPGIMGSQLGTVRADGEPPDLLWLDPDDIMHGRLAELRRGANLAIRPLGGIEFSYLPLKLRLQAAGFEVVLYDYDWREDLRIVGAALASRLRAERGRRIALIGHSMGGLLARMALSQLAGDPTAARITHVIGLGTPHGGSIGAVQAVRATYPVVFRLAAVDPLHDAVELSRDVFSTFPSIYQLLPGDTGELDLFDAAEWPRRGAQPHAAPLAAARVFNSQLAPADARFVSIIGTGQRTATAIERRGGQFHYQISAAGDGTVAVLRATLPGAHNYYLRCEHSELPRNELVAGAVIDLMRTGRTRRLPRRMIVARARHTQVSDADLRRAFKLKVDWSRLSSAERRRYFIRLNAPPAIYWPASQSAR
jgi:pimeloyl-ACP methyl ester carboxylesterase